MGEIIPQVNLEGLSQEGRLSLKRVTYDENKKSLGIAIFLLLVIGHWGAHRFYLGDHKLGLAILVVSLVLLALALFVSQLVIYSLWALGLIVFELLFLNISVKKANSNLEQQLTQDIRYD